MLNFEERRTGWEKTRTSSKEINYIIIKLHGVVTDSSD